MLKKLIFTAVLAAATSQMPALAQANFSAEKIAQVQQLAAKNDPEALFKLGVLTIDGDGVAKDPAKGVELLKKSAELGNANAAFALAVVYIFGKRGVDKNVAEGEKWLQKAIDGGQPHAPSLLKQLQSQQK